jgi:hypothetical protein
MSYFTASLLLLLQGPADSSASVLSHPLEEPLTVVADCALSSSSSNGRSNVAAYAGWSQESVVWTSRELPFVATYNEVGASCKLQVVQLQQQRSCSSSSRH